MIIFTVTNKSSGQIYVGTTRNDLESQWEKMVAAAQQDMDYPLYREIRIQGEDAFTVEEWDRAEDRDELTELEDEALRFFNAKSLRGYKTSTVRILPKKKKRQRKSSIERELASIFNELNESDSTPPSLAIKSDSAPADNNQAPKAEVNRSIESRPVENKPALQPEELKRAAVELLKEEKPAAAEETPKFEIPKTEGSHSNAVVQMNTIDLSDDITAQLAAITAAADACLAGDTSAASQLEVAAEESLEEVAEVEVEVQAAQPVAQPAPVVEREIVVAAPICPKELRIREAIERHRKMRAQRTTDTQEKERQQIAIMLAELDARARELHTGSLAAVA